MSNFKYHGAAWAQVCGLSCWAGSLGRLRPECYCRRKAWIKTSTSSNAESGSTSLALAEELPAFSFRIHSVKNSTAACASPFSLTRYSAKQLWCKYAWNFNFEYEYPMRVMPLAIGWMQCRHLANRLARWTETSTIPTLELHWTGILTPGFCWTSAAAVAGVELAAESSWKWFLMILAVSFSSSFSALVWNLLSASGSESEVELLESELGDDSDSDSATAAASASRSSWAGVSGTASFFFCLFARGLLVWDFLFLGRLRPKAMVPFGLVFCFGGGCWLTSNLFSPISSKSTDKADWCGTTRYWHTRKGMESNGTTPADSKTLWKNCWVVHMCGMSLSAAPGGNIQTVCGGARSAAFTWASINTCTMGFFSKGPMKK